MNPHEMITASELNDYVFCKRGWWLRRKGLLPPIQSMQAGTAGHEALFSRIKALRIKRIAAWLFLISGIAIMVAIILFL